jgi:phage FluMu protein Com
MSDLTCPHCRKFQNICHDDGFGYEENKLHEMRCRDCNKLIRFETSILYHYEVIEDDDDDYELTEDDIAELLFEGLDRK